MKAFVLAIVLGATAGLAADHPRLFFTDANVAKLKTPAARSNVTALAERGGLEAWCLAYRVTGEKRYAERVREALLRECRKPNWGERDLLQREPPWNAGLATARNCFNVALGYDCIRDFLSPEDRDTIAAGLVRLGIEPTLNDWLPGERRIHALDTMGHNWWSACVFSAGIAALAVLDDDPRAKGWLDKIARSSVEWFHYAGSLLENKPASFDAAGGFYESVNYAAFAVSEYLLFRLAWQNALGTPLPEIPVLNKVGDFFLNACYPNSGPMMSLNFGDSSLRADGSRPLALLWATGIRKPRYLWYLAQTKDSEFREGISRHSAFGLVYLPDEIELANAPATPDLPPSAIYRDMGWAMLRSSWEKNATLLAVKSGFTWNHAHADAGSFILFHRGENPLIDSGNCSYARPEYDQYYRQSRAHNVVLFNGEGENPEDTYFGSKTPGTVSHLVDAGELKYVLADATGPVAQNFIRNYRHFLWLGDVILIVDDLKTYRPGQFEWLLHVNGPAQRNGLDLRVGGVAVRPLFPETFPIGFAHDFPEKMRLLEKPGLKDRAPDTNVTYYAFAPPQPTRVMKFITAILLNPDSPPQIERLEARDMIGVRLRQGNTITDVYLNLLADGRRRHLNANLSVHGWETDAYLLAITFAGDKPTRYFIVNGSYLRRDGEVVLDSLSKVFAVCEGGKTTVYPK